MKMFFTILYKHQNVHYGNKTNQKYITISYCIFFKLKM